MHIVLLGPQEDADYTKYLRHVALEHLLSDRVHFPGPLWDDEKDQAIASCDIAIVSSSYENLCHFAFEAHNAGKILILSSRAGAAEMLRGAKGVLVVEPNALDIAGALTEAAVVLRNSE